MQRRQTFVIGFVLTVVILIAGHVVLLKPFLHYFLSLIQPHLLVVIIITPPLSSLSSSPSSPTSASSPCPPPSPCSPSSPDHRRHHHHHHHHHHRRHHHLHKHPQSQHRHQVFVAVVIIIIIIPPPPPPPPPPSGNSGSTNINNIILHFIVHRRKHRYLCPPRPSLLSLPAPPPSFPSVAEKDKNGTGAANEAKDRRCQYQLLALILSTHRPQSSSFFEGSY